VEALPELHGRRVKGSGTRVRLRLTLRRWRLLDPTVVRGAVSRSVAAQGTLINGLSHAC